MSLIENIENNSITKLHLTCDDEEVLDNSSAASKAIAKNSSLLSVRLDGDFLGCLRHDARTELVQSLGMLSSLQELILEDGLLQVNDIVAVAIKNKGLKELILRNVVLQGIQDDFDAAEVVFHSHNSLKELKLENCDTAVEEINLKNLTLRKGGTTSSTGEPNKSSSLNPAAA